MLARRRCSSASGSRAEHPEVKAALTWLDSLFASLKQVGNVDELRGYEGAATARYFQAWAVFLPESYPFERRSKRPPLNPVNACISFGATLVYSEVVAYLHAHGLDPSLGLLHATENGRWSLALDLMEPFRPVVVEALAFQPCGQQEQNAERHWRRLIVSLNNSTITRGQQEQNAERHWRLDFSGLASGAASAWATGAERRKALETPFACRSRNIQAPKSCRLNCRKALETPRCSARAGSPRRAKSGGRPLRP